MGRPRAPFFVSTIRFVLKEALIVEPVRVLATFRLKGCELPLAASATPRDPAAGVDRPLVTAKRKFGDRRKREAAIHTSALGGIIPCPSPRSDCRAPKRPWLVTNEGVLSQLLYRIGTVLRCPLSTITNSRNSSLSVALALR